MSMKKPPPLPSDPLDVVRAARAVVKARKEELAELVKRRGGVDFPRPSEKTLAMYEREAARLIATGDPWKAAANTTKKATWLSRKSALLYVLHRQQEDLLREQDKLQRITNSDARHPEFKNWVLAIKKLHVWTNLINQDRPDGPGEIKRRQSKRRLPTNMPNDWRETLAKRLPKWRDQFIVQAITGCRPAEIGYGIDLRIEAGQLVATIKGAKLTNLSGQEWRELRWTLTDAPALVRELAASVQAAGGARRVSYVEHGDDPARAAKAFSGAVRAAAKRAWPGARLSITPYSLRHAVASDLKASGLSSAEQSSALGHRTEDTKSVYGHNKSSRGSLAPKAVKAARPVKASIKRKAPSAKGKTRSSLNAA